jgi:extradiol dioxygenase family protein
VFFRIADGVEGHPQTLVLFDRNVEVADGRSTIDHFAFVIGLEDYDERRRQLERMGLEVRLKEFPHFHWRSLFVADPEGNTVEFVCYDPSV